MFSLFYNFLKVRKYYVLVKITIIYTIQKRSKFYDRNINTYGFTLPTPTSCLQAAGNQCFISFIAFKTSQCT